MLVTINLSLCVSYYGKDSFLDPLYIVDKTIFLIDFDVFCINLMFVCYASFVITR